MPAISCPYCGATMNLPLKFCVSCGRAISEEEIQKHGGLKNMQGGGNTKRLDDHPGPSSFDRAKRSYGIERGLRSFFMNFSYLLLFLIIFYFALTHILGEEGLNNLFPKPGPEQQTPVSEPSGPLE